MSAVIEVPIHLLMSDVETRSHQDHGVLWKTLELHGPLDSILVEGPDPQGQYYVIDGNRRLRMLKDLGYSAVPCRIVGKVTSVEERNRIRLLHQLSSKAITRAERVSLYEKAGDDPSLLSILPKHKQKQIKRDQQIPLSVRRLVDEKRASQEALAVIWLELKCKTEYRDELIDRLCAREIGTVHADALKKLVRTELYSALTENQKHFAIEAVLQKAQFTNHDADQIVIQAIMQDQPNEEYTPYWMLYINYQIESLRSQIHPEVGRGTPDAVKESIRQAVRILEQTFERAFATPHLKPEMPQEVAESQFSGKDRPRLTTAARRLSQVQFVRSPKAAVPHFVNFEGGIKAVFPE